MDKDTSTKILTHLTEIWHLIEWPADEAIYSDLKVTFKQNGDLEIQPSVDEYPSIFNIKTYAKIQEESEGGENENN